MMQNKIQLVIAKPCHENWDKMTEEQKGRFCNTCTTTVIDFTNMSDSDLLTFFKNKVSGDYCGRVLPQQLKRSLNMPLNRSIPVGYAVLLFLMLFFFSHQSNAKAQTTINPDIYAVPFKGTNSRVRNISEMPAPAVKNGRAVSGKIFTFNGQPITGAEVKQVNGDGSFVTRQNGSFVFLVDECIKQIQITAPGFETKLVTLSNKEHYEITLQPARQICPTRTEIMGKIAILKTL